MTSLRDAVAAAADFTKELPDFAALNAGDAAFEEVETSEDGRSWLITLSFPTRGGLHDGFPAAFLPTALAGRREYKVFHVDKQTGEVTKIKMRE